MMFQADELSVWYDIGGIVGSVAGGYISVGFQNDRFAVLQLVAILAFLLIFLRTN